MPNWCENDLEITCEEGKEKELAKFAKRLIVEDNIIDFNVDVPMPKEYEEGDKWYDWSIENWGTKWCGECYSHELDGDRLFISFGTAWSPPIEWLNKVAKKYPNFSFKLKYDEPGMGFCGVATRSGNACIDY